MYKKHMENIMTSRFVPGVVHVFGLFILFCWIFCIDGYHLNSFTITEQMEDFGCAQNTPTRSGNESQIFVRDADSDIACTFVWQHFMLEPSVPYMFRANCYRQNNRTACGVFSGFALEKFSATRQ